MAMHSLVAALALMAAPFWETRTPREWTMEELKALLNDSPWARTDGTQVYLATAEPMRLAEAEWSRRAPAKDRPEDPLAQDYRDFLKENEGKVIVLAALLPRPDALMNAADARKVEEKCVLKVGKKKYNITGHFPPSISDPFLRLVFPRSAVTAADKEFTFELFLPSVPNSYRLVYFTVKELYYKGRLEM